MDNQEIKIRYEALAPFLNERMRRLLVGAEATALGYGGVSIVSRMTGLSREVIAQGAKELQETQPLPPEQGRIRKPGGGRKATVLKDPTLRSDLEALIEPATRGDPESALRWTSKSTRKLAAELSRMGHKTSHRMVAELLSELGYSLQANRKTLEEGSHPDRNQQFEHVYRKVKEFQVGDQPVISVDTKKKELVGPFKNGGQEWHPKGTPEEVKSHDFKDPELGKVNPYGIYDLSKNEGWVNVGIDHDTSAFAVESIRRWWTHMGQERYPNARSLLITADSGGSNGARVRLWKRELQAFADQSGLAVSVCHFPPGTSKWNKIEHRMFSYISMNWRGRPLVSHEVIVGLIASTTTTQGLTIQCALDKGLYPKGIKVSDQEMDALSLVREDFHGEWNYTISPRLLNTS
ncbi:ISAzo13 family transposase [Ferrovum sp.]|uniref:ISAzo13 family transposase n=1 Tax=Ferrovum sp. TaxID=2609467 RepID=UPI0026136EF6|nr:ISAzo13 family transposase [Ferrovum sp.]